MSGTWAGPPSPSGGDVGAPVPTSVVSRSLLGCTERRIEEPPHMLPWVPMYRLPFPNDTPHGYTNETFETAAEWRKWLDQNRSQLFFSDVGGYKFFVGPQTQLTAEKRRPTKG